MRHLRPAIVIALVLLAGCKEQLNSGLSEREANEVVALLLRNDMPASRTAETKSGSYTVWVEGARFADAVDLLRARGLPHTKHDSIVDVFKGNGLVVSPSEERARMVYALGEELSRTISDIDGVLTARVQPVLPDNDPLRRDQPLASASVYVRYTPGSHVADLTPQIKMLVANGIAGLSYDRVSVVLVPAQTGTNEANEAQAAPMQEVAGMWVYGGSAHILQVVLAAAAGMAAVLVGLLGWLGWRARHALPKRRPGKALVIR